MRALTITPTDDGWVALPVLADPATFSYTTGGCVDWSEVVAVGDVLGLVKPDYRHMPRDWEPRFGWRVEDQRHLLVGFVRVVDVLPIVEYVDDVPDSITLIESVGLNGPALWRAGNDFAPECDIDLPDATPGGVALRVEPCECPTCGDPQGRYNSTGIGADGYDRCPTCTTPVTITGTGPIVEVAL